MPANISLLPAVDDGGDDEDDATRIVKGGALADAFGALVGGSPSGPPGELGMPADEWFVGINDVPVGPIRLGEIRKRALLGAVTPESMVWRDGLEAWRPLKTFPELVAVLEESMSSARASSAPLIRPAAGAPAPGRAAEPDSLAGASSGVTSTAVVTDDYAAAGLNQRRSGIVVWLALVVALGCGFTIAYVVFSKQRPPETIVKYVEVPAKGQATAAAVAIQDPQAATAGPAASGAAPKAHTGTKSSGIAKTPEVSADKGGGLSGLKGLSALGANGPSVGNASPGTTPVGGGGQLDGAQTQATVARYTGSVKRSCWQPALDARAPDAPTSARVTVTITVGGTGSVSNVTTSGDPRGYPGLATCIGGRVRAWQFPATGGTTTVNVPFVFAAQ
ncbi:MAG TPA: GYF domain-containing protein [Polyangiaceae bacterium]|nr:GYF domain-containing protein [Polyangiaceae bacterium]